MLSSSPGKRLLALFAVLERVSMERGLLALSKKVDGCAVVTRFDTPMFSSLDWRVFMRWCKVS